MIENRIEGQGIACSLVTQLEQIIPSLKRNDPQLRKVNEVLEHTFSQAQYELQSLQDSMNRLQEQRYRLSFLRKEFASARDVQTIVIRAYECIPKCIDVERAMLILYDEQRNVLIPGNVRDGHIIDRPLSLNAKTFSSAVSRKCLQKKKHVVVNDCSTSKFATYNRTEAAWVKSPLAIPVIVNQKGIGVLQVHFIHHVHEFTKNEIDVFQIIAELIATAIENIRLFSEQRKIHDGVKESEESYYQICKDIPVGLFRSKPNGTFLRLNPAMVHILGYPDRETLLRTNARHLYKTQQERVDWQAMVETYGLERESEVCLRGYDGIDVWVQHSSRATRGPDGKVMYYDGAIVDISIWKRAEVRLRNAMKEKELLLKEIHHRVKNNLQMVPGLLNLQSAYLRDAYDKELFKQSQNRIQAMALLHEKLCRSPEMTRIDFDVYLHSLVPSLFQSYKTTSSTIECSIESNNVLPDIDSVIPCGLMVSELATNSLKHAFPEGRVGKNTVALGHVNRQMLRLSIRDEGIDMDQNALTESTDTPMGWELANTLTDQLGGSVEIH